MPGEIAKSILRRAAALALIGLAPIAAAKAGDSCLSPCGHFETVPITRTVQVPRTRVVTLYDHCGRPYQVERTTFLPVEVTVAKRVFLYD